MYVLNKDKLYNEIEKIIEDGGSFRGFLFNTLFIYLRAEVRKAYINKDAMYHAKTFSEWNDLLDKQVPFKKDRAEPFSSFGDEESIDTFLYHNGVYTPSSEDEVLNEEFRRSVADLLGQEITDGLLGGESQRQISKKTSIPQSTISDKIQKVRRNLKKNENN
jgi:DNA-directed RNA polymerase specialized sigma24 family protein